MLKALIISLSLFFQQHVTMTSIDHVPGTDSLIIHINIDYDLLLKDYHQSVNDDIDLSAYYLSGSFPELMAGEYINTKFNLYVNDQLLKAKLLKMERSGKSICLNILYQAKTRKIKSLKVRNSILTGLYSNIENLTIIRTGNVEKGIKFTQQHTEETIFTSSQAR